LFAEARHSFAEILIAALVVGLKSFRVFELRRSESSLDDAEAAKPQKNDVACSSENRLDRRHENDPDCDSDPSAHRCVSFLALQQRMGLLPVGRNRAIALDLDNPGADRTNLAIRKAQAVKCRFVFVRPAEADLAVTLATIRGKTCTARCEAVNAMLLNEFLSRVGYCRLKTSTSATPVLLSFPRTTAV
jgi:hypothetical protein